MYPRGFGKQSWLGKEMTGGAILLGEFATAIELAARYRVPYAVRCGGCGRMFCSGTRNGAAYQEDVAPSESRATA